jgi:Domain of unknown function (DUF4476)
MNVIFLKLQFLVFLTLLFSMGVQAQNPRFIYIQTESKQPFYVKIDKKFLSSSATGYIIVAKLIEDSYALTIGFPGNEWPELHVTVNVKDINTGFLLKNYGEKGWGMVNLQTLQSQAIQKSPVANREVKTNGDEFARVLAAVVNDPSIAEITAIEETTETEVKATAESKTVEKPIVNEEIKPVPVEINSNTAVNEKTEILKMKQDSTSEGLLITYLDIVNAGTDTVKVFIPTIKTEAISEKEKQIEIAGTLAKKIDTVKRDSRFIDMELQNPNQKIDSGTVIKDDFVITEKKVAENNMPVNEAETKSAASDTNNVMINSDCKKRATQNNFLELRKKMAAEIDEKNMLKAANKQFKKTCFTTEQIKNLGVLFITEEEKYKFYVAAFPFVSDTHNFGTLEEQLTDNYYKSRFKAMLSH